MEEILLGFIISLAEGAIEKEIFSIFDKDIDYKELVKEFSEKVKEIIWNEDLEEYSTMLNSLIKEFKNEYPNITDNEAKISFIKERTNKIRTDIGLLLEEDLIDSGVFHAITGINIHIFMMAQLDNFNHKEEDYIKTNRAYLNEWLTKLLKHFQDSELPSSERDIMDIKENLHTLNFNQVRHYPNITCPKGFDKGEQRCDFCSGSELTHGCDVRAKRSDSIFDHETIYCKDLQPKYGCFYFPQRIRVESDKKYGSELTIVNSYFRCDMAGANDTPNKTFDYYYLNPPTATKQLATAKSHRLKTIKKVSDYLEKTEWVVQTLNTWHYIMTSDSWPYLLKD